MKRALGAALTAVLLVVVALLGSSLVPIAAPLTIAPPGHVSAEATGNFDQFVVVLMENHDLTDIYGPATYMTQLADQYAFAQHWQSITNPSQPNYIAILGGSTFGVSGDGNHPNLNHPTMVDVIETSGHTWKAIAEGSGSGCSINPNRGEDHFPFLSYTTITGNSARCANLVSGDSNTVIAQLNAGVNFIWFTPTDNHNMHDNSVSSGDSWLQSWVPGLLAAMAGKKAALFIMYDEGYASPPLIYAGFSGPATKTAFKSSVSYNHYSLLKLLEDVWGGGSLGQGDVGAASPVEFFNAGGPDFGIAASPSSVSFATGQSGTSAVTLQSSGGFSGAVSLTTASAPAGVTTSCTPASISGTQTSTCTFGGSTAGSYSVTVTGTSGTLVHTATVAVTVTTAGPTARFSYSPTVPKVNDTVLFDASSSSDSNSAATLQARWDWEGDGTWDTSFSSTLTAPHAFTTPGTYLVKLEIQDSSGFSTMQSQGVLVIDLQGTGGGAPPGYGLVDPSTLQPHAPIAITSNGGFSAANGVRSGTGSATDPYIIRDWFIDGNSYASTQAMLWIESTDAYVVIENVRIANLAGTNQWEGIQLGHWPATVSTQHVTIRHNAIENAQHAYGIVVRSGSSDVHVEANYVSMDANFEWVFGIATDRGVHDVTVTGNYVNAYTSGTFHTAGIHLGDTYVDDASRATGLIATRNTVVNATAGGIVTASAMGTVITGNLVYMDYPGRKTVAADAPHGIDITEKSDGATVVGNVIHSFQWGILVGSDNAQILSNTIFDVDYAIYVPDSGSLPGVSSSAGTIYDTTAWGSAMGRIRLSPTFQGTVVDLGAGIRSTDLSAVVLQTSGPATRIVYAWSGRTLNVSATVGAAVAFATAATEESQTLQGAWTGSLESLQVTALSPGKVSFALQSAPDAAFEGSGFTPSTLYTLSRSNGAGSSEVLTAQSTPSGGLAFTIPGAGPSTYELTGAGSSSFIFPIPFETIPLLFPLIAVALLWVSYLFVRWTRRQRWDEDRSEPKRSAWESDDSDTDEPNSDV